LPTISKPTTPLDEPEESSYTTFINNDSEGDPFMKKHKFNSNQYAKNVDALPELCFAKSIMEDDVLVVIKRGERGYYPADMVKYPLATGETNEQRVRRLNEKLGVTTAQRMAMVMGSVAGFDVGGAHPKEHREHALVEDLFSVKDVLGHEAKHMFESGATYDEVHARIKSIVEQAAVGREELVA
jgi:hypothetical protein